MEHRHTFGTPQIVETDNDNGWIYEEQPYLPIARGLSESSSTSYPVDSMTIQGGHFPSQWTPTTSSTRYSSSNINVQLPYYQAVAPGPSHDSYLHQHDGGNQDMHQDNFSYHPSSSNMGGQTVHSADNGFYDQTVARGRGPYKRKSPDVDLMCEEGHANWEYPPCYGVNTVGNEGASRNIRSKASHLSNSMHASSSRSSDRSDSRDFWGQSLNVPARDWNRNLVSPIADGATFGSNSGVFLQHPAYPNTLNSHPNGSLQIGGSNTDISNRNHIAENRNKSVRGVRSGHGQRSTSTFRASSSNFCNGFVAASDEGQHMVAEGYPSRHPRPSSTSRLCNVGSIGRNHISIEQGIVVADHSSYYGSRSVVDQHRDMRLDVDNMSYEELLALEERIGSVSTGLSDCLISKSLTESIYCSSDLFEDDETCIICLEEYRNMDDVATVRVCGHDFHVGCIRKWLSMKNWCPICKASAIDEGTKGKLKGL